MALHHEAATAEMGRGEAGSPPTPHARKPAESATANTFKGDDLPCRMRFCDSASS